MCITCFQEFLSAFLGGRQLVQSRLQNAGRLAGYSVFGGRDRMPSTISLLPNGRSTLAAASPAFAALRAIARRCQKVILSHH